MDPNFFAMYPGLVDPWKCLEMQAKYLRLLAEMYADAPSSVDTTASSPAVQITPQLAHPRKKLASAHSAAPPHSNPQSTRPLSPPPPAVEVVPAPPKPQNEVIVLSPPRERPQTAAEPVLRNRKVIDFDEVPVGGGGRDFKAIMEKALREDKEEAVRPVESGRPREFLKKKTRASSVARPRVSEPQEQDSPPIRRSETPKRPPREFLKRGSGQLCINPKSLKPESRDTPDESFVSQKSYHSAVPRAKPAPAKAKPQRTDNDSEMVKRLKKQVQEVTQSKKSLQEEHRSVRAEEEALSEEVEEMKKSLVPHTQELLREEIECKKRDEIATIQKERKVLLRTQRSSQVDETEELKAIVKGLQEEAQKQEAANKAEVEELKTSIRRAKPLPFSSPITKPLEPQSVKSTTAVSVVSKSPLLSAAKPVNVSAAVKPAQELRTVAEVKKVEKVVKVEKKVNEIAKKNVKMAEAMELSSDEEEDVRDHEELPLDEDIDLRSFPVDTSRLLTTNKTPDGKVQKTYESGRKEILFADGVRKEIFPDGFVVVYFKNQDIKQIFPTGEMVYYFKETETTQITFPDGMLKFKFPTGQTEKHYTDGTKEVAFADGTVKCIFPDGEEESIFPDGTVQKRDVKGVKYIDFASGQKDTIFPDGSKERVYPDGSVQRFRADGSPY